MREAVIRLIMPDNWVKEISSKYDVSFNCIQCVPYDDYGGRGLFEVKGEGDKLKEIMVDLENQSSIIKVEMFDLNQESMIFSIFTRKCIACRTLASSNCYLISGKFIGDGSVEWKLITGDEGSLSLLFNDLKKNGCEVELVNANKLNNRALLTDRQLNIIREAFEKGYYDYPKKINIKELSKIFKISSSTLGETLQRGEKKVLYEHFRKLYYIPFFLYFPRVC